MISFLILLPCAYLLGAFPSAWLAGKLSRGIDIRQHGSGNAGATNTLRVLGKGWAAAVLCVDAGKAALAVLLAGLLFPEGALREPARVLAGLLAVVGHVYPVFTAFRGGKGVAPAAGMLTALYPLLAPFCLTVFVVVLLLTKTASLASLCTAVTLPIVYSVLSLWVLGPFSFWILGLCVAVALFVVYTHRSNIRRLRAGKEHGLEATQDPPEDLE